MTPWKACLLCGAWRSRPRPYTTARAANERIAAHWAARGGDGDERERVATAARCVICAQWRHARGGGADGAERVGCGGGDVTSAQGVQIRRTVVGETGGASWRPGRLCT
ncbi:hypothetical protein B0H10DRAFT_2095535 [Mycena sp. CBHHK59/15]|nr:hypothetical protein B0H10DRAFT_2095535 [Mycena sp. CBHHK59/15]